MPVINIDSILDKVYAWERSDKGQKKIQGTVNKYVRNNVSRTKAGSRVVTQRDMLDAARKLVQTIKDTAHGCDLPTSVLAHFDSLSIGKLQRQADDSYTIEINFTDDLTRESLQPEKYGGVRNIIAIFNNGYPADRSRSEAISHVAGYWHGKETVALEFRPGLYFLQDAVNDFNMNYGMPLGMYAELGAVYDSE
jgi:hypothetical protein